jgi:fibronectin-binding autotransporter adhesin
MTNAERIKDWLKIQARWHHMKFVWFSGGSMLVCMESKSRKQKTTFNHSWLMKKNRFLSKNSPLTNLASMPVLALILLIDMIAASAGFAAVGTDTWSGAGAATATTGWTAPGNWAAGSANPTPNAGDTLVFIGSSGLTNGDDIAGALSIGGLTFGSSAGAFILGATSGDSIALTTTATITDNSSVSETINLPMALGAASQNVNVISGGSLTINGLISGTGPLVTVGGGLLTLTGQAAGANTYSGGTVINSGTLGLDFSQGGSTPAGGILASGALTLGGGTLTVNGGSGATDSQAFAGGTTLNPGQNIIAVTNGPSGGTATVTLNGLTVNSGASVVFYGPASSTAGVAATGTITTTTAGVGQTTAGQDGILAKATANNAYATAGLYDWATTDSGALTAGTTITGGSSISGFYVVAGNNSNIGSVNWDIATQQNPLTFSSATTARVSANTTAQSIRFNTGIAPYLDVRGGNTLQTGGLLVTPNLGVINVGVGNARLNNSTCQIVQNNTTGLLIIGIDSTSTSIWQAFTGAAITDTTDNVVKSGAGTMVLNPIAGMGFPINYTNGGVYTVSTSGRITVGTYDSVDVANTTPAAFYFNGGVTVINNPNQLGNPTAQGTTAGAVGTVNLNGGTLMSAMGSFSLINAAAGSAARPVFLGGNGGGLAAQTTNTLTIPGVISSVSGTGPLTIGIPASNANGGNAGLVPGTGSIGSYVTKNPAFNANGTVLLTATNTYGGNTVISSGTLQLGASASISNSTNIIVGTGAIFDVSQVSGGFTLGTNQVQNLMGSGSVTGAVVVASGSGIYGGTDGTYGTNTFNSNLTLSAGAVAVFDLNPSTTASNDEIVVNGNLTLNGTIIHLKAPNTTGPLAAGAYTLFTSPNPLTINGGLSLVWDVPPSNFSKYSIAVTGNSIILQFVAGAGPIIASVSASPGSAYPNQTVFISATVLTNNNPINSISVDVSQTAGTAPGTTILPLVLSATANIYTNSVVVGASVPANSTTTNIVTAVDNANTVHATNVLNIISGAPTISASASPNPAGLGQTITITATVLGNSYPINTGKVTVDVSAIAGTPPGTTILTLNLSATPNVYTNRYTVLNTTGYGAQTLTVQAINSGSETNTASIILTVSPLDVWNGLGADNNWTTGGNWRSGLTPGTGDFVTFAGNTPPPLTPDMNNNYSIGSLVFDPTAGAFNITNDGTSTLTLTGGVTNNSANVQTVSVPVALGGTQAFNAGSNNIVISNSLADDSNDSLIGGVIAAGTNTLTLAGNNTYTGPTTVNSNSKLTIAGTGQLGGGTYAQTIADNGILNYNSSAAQTLSGAISGGGILTVNNSVAVLTLSVANSYSGGTLINSGIVQAPNATSFGTGTITNNGGTILLPSAAVLSVANNLWITGTSTIDQNNAIGSDNFNGTLGGNGTLIITNLALTDPATFSTFTIGGSMAGFTGKIIIASTTSAGTPAAGYLRFNSGTPVNNTGSANASFNLGASPSQVTLCTRLAQTANLGELTGGSGTFVEGSRSGAGTTIWSIGGLNTSTTFAGTIFDRDPGLTVTGTIVALTKVGTGTLSLSGQNTYTGSTTVSNGVLALTTNLDSGLDGSIAGSASIFINSGAALDLSGLHAPTLTLNSSQTIGGGGTNNGSLNANGSTINPGSAGHSGTLTINGALIESGVNHNFSLSGPGSTNDLIAVNGNIDVSSGTQNINLTEFGGGSFVVGTYPLFTYTGTLTGGTNNFTINLGASPLAAILTNITTTTPSQIAIIISLPARPATNLVWKGDGGANNWDLITSNWVNGATSFSFQTGDSVFFTDSGAPNTNVTLQATLFPASLIVSNSTLESYAFTGSGVIAGSIGLIKTNSGTLTIQNTNTYTGPTIFGGGTVSVSSLPNGGSASPIGAASNNSTNLVFSGGALAYTGGTAGTDRGAILNAGGGTFDIINSTTLTLGGVITGSGPLTLIDTGGLTLTNANTYSGGTMINNGTLTLGIATAVGTGAITMNGGTLGFISSLTIANSMVVGGNFTININNAAQINPTFSGNITGTGNMNVTIVGSVNHNVQFSGATTLNGWTGSVVFPDNSPGGFVRQTSAAGTGAWSKTLGLDLGGGTSTAHYTDRNGNFDNFAHISGGSSTIISGPQSGTGNLPMILAIGFDNTSTTYSGIMSENAASPSISLIKVGTGTFTLGGACAYSGQTIISNGVLNVAGSLTVGAVGGSTNYVFIYAGTLGGSGTINASVTNYSGGAFAPGAGTNVAGTVLTINNSLTLLSGSTNLMQVIHNGNNGLLISDNANCGGNTIIYGGTLIIVTNAGDSTPYAVGDNCKLFSASTITGNFISIQPAPGSGLAWSNDVNNLGSFIVVSNAVVIPPAPAALFSGAPTNLFVTQSVVFTNTSSGSFTNSAWSFGDGNVATNSGAGASNNVSNTYSNPGIYTVRLIVTGAGGSGTNTQVNYIVVKPKVTIGKPVLSGGNLILSGTNGPAGQPYRILSSTNVALNITNWIPVFTNAFAPDGSYIYTNTPVTNKATFFRLVSP